MKVQQRSTGLMADIVMNKTDGMETAAFIRQQMIIFPALSPLVLFLKLFLAQRNLHDTLAFIGKMQVYFISHSLVPALSRPVAGGICMDLQIVIFDCI